MTLESHLYETLGTDDGTKLGLTVSHYSRIVHTGTLVSTLAKFVDGGVKYGLVALALLVHCLGIHEQDIAVTHMDIGVDALPSVGGSPVGRINILLPVETVICGMQGAGLGISVEHHGTVRDTLHLVRQRRRSELISAELIIFRFVSAVLDTF